MKVSVLASPNASHQLDHAHAIKQGFARNGIAAQVCYYNHQVPAFTDVVVCWGWRVGKSYRNLGYDVLVMERGYIGDRFIWTSLGWNGLNGRATMPIIDDGGARFRHYHSSLLKERDYGRNDYVLLIGQVPGDAALGGKDLSDWYRSMMREAQSIYQLPVRFRPHPRASFGAYPKELMLYTGDLLESIAGARAVITYNSNTAVEAVLAGKPALAFDEGSMAWEVCSHVLGDDYNGDRLDWAYKLAWKQWLMSELEDGSAVNYLLRLR